MRVEIRNANADAPPEHAQQVADWIASRPENVQLAAQLYPIGCVLHFEGHPPLYMLGYTEYADGRVGLKVSHIDPATHYEEALSSVRELCPDCLTSSPDHPHAP